MSTKTIREPLDFNFPVWMSAYWVLYPNLKLKTEGIIKGIEKRGLPFYTTSKEPAQTLKSELLKASEGHIGKSGKKFRYFSFHGNQEWSLSEWGRLNPPDKVKGYLSQTRSSLEEETLLKELLVELQVIPNFEVFAFATTVLTPPSNKGLSMQQKGFASLKSRWEEAGLQFNFYIQSKATNGSKKFNEQILGFDHRNDFHKKIGKILETYSFQVVGVFSGTVSNNAEELITSFDVNEWPRGCTLNCVNSFSRSTWFC